MHIIFVTQFQLLNSKLNKSYISIKISIHFNLAKIFVNKKATSS